jgi:hypothetical protein
MAKVHERIYIEAPYTQAVVAFERRLGFGGNAENGTCTLTLVVPTGTGHDVARVVSAATSRVPGNANYTTRYAIAWKGGIVEGIPTPGFFGALTLSTGETYRETMLELTGRYDPPGGIIGDLFDEVVGRRIAHATLSGLLDEVGRELHSEHESIEAAKLAVRAER